MPKQGKAKRDGVINPQFQLILKRKFDALKTLQIDRRAELHVPSGTPLSTSSDTHQVVEIQTRDFY